MKIDQHLLDRYRDGACTKEELEWLKGYFQQGDYVELDNILREEWEGLTTGEIESNESFKQDSWKAIVNEQAEAGNRVIFMRRPLFRITSAAAALALLFIGAWYWFGAGNEQGQMVEIHNQSNIPEEVVMQDGTMAWLTPGSRILFPEQFEAGERRVRLEGEARFEVQSDTKRPFIVRTEKVFTRVLGTTFNVRAFPNRRTIEVVLLEGKVAVDIEKGQQVYEAITLSPGEAFTFEKVSGSFYKKALKNTGAYDWKEGVINFHRAGIDEVIQTLENWYGITISIEDSSMTYESLVHRIDTRKMNLSEVLDGIGLVANYRFKKTGNDEYLVTPK